MVTKMLDTKWKRECIFSQKESNFLYNKRPCWCLKMFEKDGVGKTFTWMMSIQNMTDNVEVSSSWITCFSFAKLCLTRDAALPHPLANVTAGTISSSDLPSSPEEHLTKLKQMKVLLGLKGQSYLYNLLQAF